MLTNADCTLYRFNAQSGSYDRYFISGVYWRENKTASVLKSGLQTADSTTVYFYSDRHIPENPAKDMLVKGNCPFEFTGTDEKEVSQQMKDFRAAYKFVTVTAIDEMIFGTLPHIEVSGE